jgi:hypothetical protein
VVVAHRCGERLCKSVKGLSFASRGECCGRLELNSSTPPPRCLASPA